MRKYGGWKILAELLGFPPEYEILACQNTMEVKEHIDGVVIGVMLGFKNDKPLVSFVDNSVNERSNLTRFTHPV